MIAVYRMLLRLYPKAFRSAFAEEILATQSRIESDRANHRLLHRALFRVREISGLLKGIFVEWLQLARPLTDIPAVPSVSSSVIRPSVVDEIAKAEEAVRFHLAKTIDCIAHHQFEGARLHAREEDRARQHLSRLKEPPIGRDV